MNQILVDVAEMSKELCKQPIEGKLVYATRENFLGRIVKGYHKEASGIFLLASEAAKALCMVQNRLLKQGYKLYFYDGVRPLRAVRDFGAWFQAPPHSHYELDRKKLHYPHINKTDLARLGYAAGDISRHCFGHAVDVTLMSCRDGSLVDMGAVFDYFDELSHLDVTVEQIGQRAYDNRMILQTAMKDEGFIPFDIEFWHFDYQIKQVDEPFDFEITPNWRSAKMLANG